VRDIIRHNSRAVSGQVSWTKGVNAFTDFSSNEMRAKFGHSKDVQAQYESAVAGGGVLHASQGAPAHVANTPLSALPSHVDWRQAGAVTAVKNQGQCGSCWAFAATETLESHVFINTGILQDLAVQQPVSCAPNPQECGGTGGCSGATAQIAWDYVVKTGQTSEWQYPYDSYYGTTTPCVFNSTSKQQPVAKITGHTVLQANNQTALMQTLALVGPLAVSVDASHWKAYKGGVFDGCDYAANMDVNHAVVLVGYGTDAASGKDYWLIRNSWSPSWGEKGYIRLQRDADEDVKCGIDSTPQDGSACKGDDTPKKVCGQCAVLYDTAYPLGASL
jgi:cathepsin L